MDEKYNNFPNILIYLVELLRMFDGTHFGTRWSSHKLSPVKPDCADYKY